MIPVQFDFFKTEEESELEALKNQVQDVKNSCDKVRKGLFARHGELFKLILDIEERLKIIERNICGGVK